MSKQERSDAMAGAKESLADKTWPVFDAEMVEVVTRVLEFGRVNYWTGCEGRLFEAEMASFLHRSYAVALTNGTSALELALRALGVGPGDEVITTPRSFIASASCAVMRGARPIFADVDRDTGTIVAKTIEAAITSRTRAIIVVHLGGWPCDMEPILEVAKQHGIKVVEDVAQALGGHYRGQALGAWGDVGAFSFCADKILSTAGEGGLLTMNDEALFRDIWSRRDHGRDWDATFNKDHPVGYKWVRHQFGSNYRMSEVQAAVGRIGLKRLNDWRVARKRNCSILIRRFRDLSGLRVPEPPDGHANYMLYTYVRPECLKTNWTRDRILGELLSRNVPCSVGTCGELYLEEAFDKTGLRPAVRLPIARELGETSIAFPLHPALTSDDMHELAEEVRDVVAQATL